MTVAAIAVFLAVICVRQGHKIRPERRSAELPAEGKPCVSILVSTGAFKAGHEHRTDHSRRCP